MLTELHLKDSIDVLRSFKDKSVYVITDPPYGINFTKMGGRRTGGWASALHEGKTWDELRPSKEYFDEILRISIVAVIWGGNYFTDYLPPSMRWLIWDKGQRNFSLSDFEMAWTNQQKACRIFNYSRAKALQDKKVHPTQKPIAVMEWVLRTIKIPEDISVFDPFMGSGTTGVACKRLGIPFIGCEINDAYFEIARSRIENQPSPLIIPSD